MRPTDERATATVVGGGPAGLMAAEVLAASGMSVTVFDHMPSLGRKLLLAGRGGLNITHSEPTATLLGRYGPARSRLEPAIAAFDPAALRAWCADLGEPTFIGSSGRVFPASFRATSLLRAWLRRLAGSGVAFAPRHRWIGWDTSPSGALDPRSSRFSLADGGTASVSSDVNVFALGGASWPRVGSDGGWVDTFRRAGIAVNELRPANCGVRVDWSTDFVERFAGVPLKNVAVSVGGVSVRGDAMVTRSGLEGGCVYAHSRALREAIDHDGRCAITIDLHPDLTTDRLVERLSLRRPKDSVSSTLRRTLGLTPVAAAVLRELTGNLIPSDLPAMAAFVKAVPLVVYATMPIDRAISTAGGVALTEVDDHFMLRRLPGNFVAGEMLDWEAPTGGYLLQAAISTGHAAATGAAAWANWRTTPTE